jgi:hypothetical protein
MKTIKEGIFTVTEDQIGGINRVGRLIGYIYPTQMLEENDKFELEARLSQVKYTDQHLPPRIVVTAIFKKPFLKTVDICWIGDNGGIAWAKDNGTTETYLLGHLLPALEGTLGVKSFMPL